MFKEISKSYIKLLLRKGMRVSYSQFGEDAILQNLLRKKYGVYVDIGAYHPTLYSNTYAFYRRGWKGVAIDPNPWCEKLFKIMRPRDMFIRAAVGNSGEQEYYEYNDAACNSVGIPAPTRKDLKLVRTSQVKVAPLSELLRNIPHIDLMNIDVEGMDAEVMETYDWHSFPSVLAVEGKLGDTSMDFLKGKGYELVGLAGATMLFKHA